MKPTNIRAINGGRTPHLFPPTYTLVRTEPKIGRNDPCPCGSGKKYKKCCLPKDKKFEYATSDAFVQRYLDTLPKEEEVCTQD